MAAVSAIATELRAYRGEPRTSLGWRLAKSAWRLLRYDHGLLVPALLLAGLLAVDITVAAWAPAATPGLVADHHHIFVRALTGAVFYFGVTFLLAAVAIAVDATVDGVPTGATESLREATEILGPILRWALISVAVWYGGQIVTDALDNGWPLTLIAIAWFVASFFVIPLMAIERIGPGEALAESVRLLREGWRETAAGIVGIVAFTAMALVLPGLMLSHASALNHEGHGVDYPLVVAAFVLLCLVTASSVATKEAFAVLLERQLVDDMPGSEYGGRRLRRRTKVLRVVGAVALVFLALAGLGSATKHDHQTNTNAEAPGANFTILVENPEGAELPSGAPVMYEGRTVGSVLGSDPEGAALKVTFHVEPGIGPEDTPGSFHLVTAGASGPFLLLLPSGSGGFGNGALPS